MKSFVLIPLAGAGKRFVDAGYQLPKPLIPISGVPMIVNATRALPKATNYVFLCRQEHLGHFPLERCLIDNFDSAQIVTVERLTEGQASTCLLAEPIVDQDALLHIGACDNSMIYDEHRWTGLFDEKGADALIWTFRGNPTVLQKPSMYGWVRVDAANKAREVSCKKPISDSPMNDHAIVGAFSFRRAGTFFNAAKKLIAENRRINNEFYVDEVMNVLIEDGARVFAMEVDHYICWGTPNDLRVFEYWQSFFDLNPNHPYQKGRFQI